MRVAQQIPAAGPDDDGPWVDVLLPLPASLAAVADAHPVLGRDGGDQGAGGVGARAHGPAVGGGAGILAHGSGRPGDVFRQRPEDLPRAAPTGSSVSAAAW